MISFEVKPDHGDKYVLTAGSRDILMWERTTKGRTFSSLAEGVAMVDIYRIAFLAAKRQELWDGKEVDFEATHEIEVLPGEAPDPTP